MRRKPALTPEYISRRLMVDLEAGRCFWLDPTRQHANLAGREAGFPWQSRPKHAPYWAIKLNGVSYKRSYLVFCIATGKWPTLVDHIDGNSLNDSIGNLREATIKQNSWNHRTRTKKSPLPMGIRQAGKKYVARIACDRKPIHIGTFDDIESALAAYQAKRRELFGAYCGL